MSHNILELDEPDFTQWVVCSQGRVAIRGESWGVKGTLTASSPHVLDLNYQI